MIKFIDLGFKIDKVWVSSDFHAYHKNICKGISTWSDTSQCRDFKDEIKMTNHLIEQINKYVQKDDLLIHGGDWAFGGIDNILEFREHLNCQNIINIIGNHDHHFPNLILSEYDSDILLNFSEQQQSILQGFLRIESNGYYQFQGQKIFFSHYPHLFWHQHAKHVPNLFGHCHASIEGVGKSMDIGIDNAFKLYGEYRPFRLEEALKIVSRKITLLETHHTPYTN